MGSIIHTVPQTTLYLIVAGCPTLVAPLLERQSLP